MSDTTVAAAMARLPLQQAEFHILLVLAEGDNHGYLISQEVERRTQGHVTLPPGTLYRTLQRLVDDGLIVESARRPARVLDDGRRRYYRITPFGTAVASGETARLASLVRLAKSCGISPLPPVAPARS